MKTSISVFINHVLLSKQMKLHSQTKDELSFHQRKLAQKIITANVGFVYFTA
jgi:hypothetical protein